MLNDMKFRLIVFHVQVLLVSALVFFWVRQLESESQHMCANAYPSQVFCWIHSGVWWSKFQYFMCLPVFNLLSKWPDFTFIAWLPVSQTWDLPSSLGICCIEYLPLSSNKSLPLAGRCPYSAFVIHNDVMLCFGIPDKQILMLLFL